MVQGWTQFSGKTYLYHHFVPIGDRKWLSTACMPRKLNDTCARLVSYWTLTLLPLYQNNAWEKKKTSEWPVILWWSCEYLCLLWIRKTKINSDLYECRIYSGSPEGEHRLTRARGPHSQMKDFSSITSAEMKRTPSSVITLWSDKILYRAR